VYSGNKAPGFQPYDTFQCQDGWVFIGVLGPVMFPRLTKLLGFAPEEFSFDACSSDAAAVNSAKGLEFDRILREYCAERNALEVETVLNNAQIGCSRVFGVQDQYEDAHYRAREMTVPVLDRQSGVPVHVYGVVPKLSLTPGQIWRGAPAIGEDTTQILTTMLGLSDEHIAALYDEQVVHRTEPFDDAQVEPAHP
jgi:crotonobetainyl-CoA:carnitine CoA-transferase CaiB-like acyl-CoA transferase